MSAYEKSANKTESKAKNDGKTPAKMLRLFALYENLIRFVMPLCTALTDREHPRTPITQSNNIVDISGVGLKQFWNLRGHMQDASTLATAHYPETLDRIFVCIPSPFLSSYLNLSPKYPRKHIPNKRWHQIIGAPAFFPTVWGWIKKWFDPITTSKIFILSHSDMKRTLESFIDPANIPKKYGGQLEFEFGDFPNLDPALRSVLQWEGDRKDFPHGPLYWVDKSKKGEEGSVIEALAVGSVGEKERREDICTVARRLPEIENKDEVTNGHAAANFEVPTIQLRSELLRAPTETETLSEPVPTQNNSSASSKAEVQEGELVPASGPEPVTFVTAHEGVQSLSLNEKSGNEMNGFATGPHETMIANRLDPNLHVSDDFVLEPMNGTAIESKKVEKKDETLVEKAEL